MVKKLRSVIGANYGDEGKGLVTDYFAAKDINDGYKTIVVCMNGGAQRGHTVVLPDGRRHVFHHFGSGTFAGADTYLSPHFIVEPMSFCAELKELSDVEIGKIFVSANCRVTTPYEIIMNKMLEESRGENRHGSCGMGIWETVNGYRQSTEYLRFGEIVDINWELAKRKENFVDNLIKHHRSGEITNEIYNKWMDIIVSPDLYKDYVIAFNRMRELSCVSDYRMLKKYDSVITENGQGLLLSEDKDNVHTTPSNTGLKYVKEIEEILGMQTEPIYVTRTYLTRHGAGDFEEKDIGTFDDKTNVPNEYQGSMRYGKLGLDILQRVKMDAGNRKKSLFITHANEVPASPYLVGADGFKNVYVSSSEVRNEKVMAINNE